MIKFCKWLNRKKHIEDVLLKLDCTYYVVLAVAKSIDRGEPKAELISALMGALDMQLVAVDNLKELI